MATTTTVATIDAPVMKNERRTKNVQKWNVFELLKSKRGGEFELIVRSTIIIVFIVTQMLSHLYHYHLDMQYTLVRSFVFSSSSFSFRFFFYFPSTFILLLRYILWYDSCPGLYHRGRGEKFRLFFFEYCVRYFTKLLLWMF